MIVSIFQEYCDFDESDKNPTEAVEDNADNNNVYIGEVVYEDEHARVLVEEGAEDDEVQEIYAEDHDVIEDSNISSEGRDVAL